MAKVTYMGANPYSDYPGVRQTEGRLGGKPTLGDSRVPADLVAECLDAGDPPEDVAFNYTLRLQDVLNFKAYRDAHQAAIKP